MYFKTNKTELRALITCWMSIKKKLQVKTKSQIN